MLLLRVIFNSFFNITTASYVDNIFRDHPFCTYAKFSEKLVFFTRTCTLSGCVRNVSFSENFPFALNE